VSYIGGGGALLAASTLVLIPRGIEDTLPLFVAFAFAAGGLVFCGFSAWTRRTRNSASQFLSMLLDFLPEAILLVTLAASGSNVVFLLAGLMALQNMPEGFAAYHEIQGTTGSPGRLLMIFLVVSLVGPLAAWVGFAFLSSSESALAMIMLFCSGGIVYLIFEDIATEAHSKRDSFPAMGAAAGFLLGLIGTMMIH
jgi:ZIP family zinc transporter